MLKKEPLYIFCIVFVAVSVLMWAALVPSVPINRLRFLGAMLTFFTLSFGVCLFRERIQNRLFNAADGRLTLHSAVESKTALVLTIFVLLTLLWCGIDIFMNPYLYDYNHGNGAYFAQVLGNICRGVGPENTVKYNEVLYYHSNPYYYASAFAAVPHVLATLCLPLLYRIFPFPPMHVFAVVMMVICLGSIGVYAAVRALGGTKTLSLLSSVGYCLIPWVELPIFMHGHFDVISYAVYPYIFASLFSRRWLFLYISVLLLALINIPYAYSAVALGIVAAVFFRAPVPGTVVLLIGVSVLFWDQAVVKESLKGIWDVVQQPSGTMVQILKDMDATLLVKAALYHVVYLFLLLVTVSFIPVYGLRRNRRWNWPVAGMLLFALVGAVMGFFRSYDIASHRNGNMVVPIYLSAFMVITRYFDKPDDDSGAAGGQCRNGILMVLLLAAGVVSTSLWFSNHYPWAGVTNNGIVSLNYLRASSTRDRFEHVLGKLKEFVPPDASVAYRIDSGIQAYITNRQKAWYLGYHPEGVEYFFIQTKQISYIDRNLPPWQEELTKIEEDRNNKLLYRDEILVVYRNSNPKPIPRLESALGWSVLFRALIPERLREGSR